jgi:hypothetical protein
VKTRNGKSSVQRSVALCYVRQSYTRAGEPDDQNSPERQRANIQAVCDKNGWLPEWYEDVGGHTQVRPHREAPPAVDGAQISSPRPGRGSAGRQ